MKVYISILSMGIYTHLDRCLAVEFEQSEDIKKTAILGEWGVETADWGEQRRPSWSFRTYAVSMSNKASFVQGY